jgi:hypothetical protein
MLMRDEMKTQHGRGGKEKFVVKSGILLFILIVGTGAAVSAQTETRPRVRDIISHLALPAAPKTQSTLKQAGLPSSLAFHAILPQMWKNSFQRQRSMAHCAYCGLSRDSLERDHIPPRCLYSESRRASLNLITVPACASCNRDPSSDEATFRNVMLVAGDENAAVSELWPKADRSFYYEDGRKRATDLWQMFVPVTIRGEERKMIFPARSEAVLRVLRKIVRGLAHYHGLGTAIPESRVWVDVLKHPLPEELLKSETFHHRDRQIFEYWFEQVQQDDIDSIWCLKFFEKRIFIASVAA